MSVMNYIRRAKEDFKDHQNRVSIERVNSESNRLLNEKARQMELEKATRPKAALEREVRNLREFNKQQTPPSTIQKFGSGLARVMNEQKARGSSSTFGNQPRGGTGKRVGGKLSRINEGSRGIAFGGGNSGDNPFSSGRRDLEFGRPAPAIRERPKPKSKTILRY